MKARYLLALVLACSGCAAPTPTFPDAPAPPPYAQPATVPDTFRIFTNDPLLAGGATMIQAMAMGYASDGVLRGVPNLNVQWTVTGATMSAPYGTTTDGSGLTMIILTAPRSEITTDVQIDATAGGRSSALHLLVPPSWVHPGPPGATGGTGGTGSTGGTGVTGRP